MLFKTCINIGFPALTSSRFVSVLIQSVEYTLYNIIYIVQYWAVSKNPDQLVECSAEVSAEHSAEHSTSWSGFLDTAQYCTGHSPNLRNLRVFVNA